MTAPLGIQSYSLTCRELTIKVAWLASASLNWTPWPQRRPLSHVQLQPVPGIKQCMSLVPHQAGTTFLMFLSLQGHEHSISKRYISNKCLQSKIR